MSSAARVQVSFCSQPEEVQNLRFSQSFKIGRSNECEVCIPSEYVSRVHAEVVLQNGGWWVKDKGSSNGIFIENQRVQIAQLKGRATIRLGVAGPTIELQLEQPLVEPQSKSPALNAKEAQYIERYFGKANADVPFGDHTIMVRRAFQRVQDRQRRAYAWTVAFFLVCILGAGAYAHNLHREVSRNKASAAEMFYSMKELDVNIANLERLLMDSSNQQSRDEIRKYQKRRQQMEKNYDQVLTSLNLVDRKLSERDKLILRVARIFGESEIAMPAGFVAEVDSYIGKWKSSGRLARAVAVAKQKGYDTLIARELLEQDLPPQFFYLALQESDFDPWASGPMTRKGIAKGMWQFIPETGMKYGLRIGPLAEFPRPDPADGRQHYDLATKAAARYIKDLYGTEAQASGLLVMACYNWGDARVLPLVLSLPGNPRERNFWKLLAKYRDRIPNETYDYVFYIVSAAVIGENPRLFGFDFDNPLAI